MNGLITINDVARAANVSPATVSLALNGNPCVKALTRERIVQLAREMGYTPNRLAQGLARRRSGLVGLVVPDIESIYYGKVVRYIDEAVSLNGYQLTLAISNNCQDTERRIIGKFIEQQVEGVIVAPINRPAGATDYYQDLTRHRIPFLFITAYYPGITAPCVMADLNAGTRALAGHLLARGCRDISFLAGFADVVTTRCRLEGFRQALPPDAEDSGRFRVIHCPHVDYATGFAQAQAILRNGLPVDAIVAINDEMALGALNAAAGLGCKVPEQLAIAGYDNVIFSSAANVPITTVDQNIDLLCRQGADLLRDMIQAANGRGRQAMASQLIETSLIIRRSTEFGSSTLSHQ